MSEAPRDHTKVAERIRHLVKLADNDSEHEGSLSEYLSDQALDIADDLSSLVAARKTIAMYRAEGKAALDALAAAREENGRLREALEELVKRASDPDIEATAVGARIMLDEAREDAEAALAGKVRE